MSVAAANCTMTGRDKGCQAARFGCITRKLEAVYRAPSVVVVTFFILVSLASLLVLAGHSILNKASRAVRTDTTFTLLKPGLITLNATMIYCCCSLLLYHHHHHHHHHHISNKEAVNHRKNYLKTIWRFENYNTLWSYLRKISKSHKCLIISIAKKL